MSGSQQQQGKVIEAEEESSLSSYKKIGTTTNSFVTFISQVMEAVYDSNLLLVSSSDEPFAQKTKVFITFIALAVSLGVLIGVQVKNPDLIHQALSQDDLSTILYEIPQLVHEAGALVQKIKDKDPQALNELLYFVYHRLSNKQIVVFVFLLLTILFLGVFVYNAVSLQFQDYTFFHLLGQMYYVIFLLSAILVTFAFKKSISFSSIVGKCFMGIIFFMYILFFVFGNPPRREGIILFMFLCLVFFTYLHFAFKESKEFDHLLKTDGGALVSYSSAGQQQVAVPIHTLSYYMYQSPTELSMSLLFIFFFGRFSVSFVCDLVVLRMKLLLPPPPSTSVSTPPRGRRNHFIENVYRPIAFEEIKENSLLNNEDELLKKINYVMEGFRFSVFANLNFKWLDEFGLDHKVKTKIQNRLIVLYSLCYLLRKLVPCLSDLKDFLYQNGLDNVEDEEQALRFYSDPEEAIMILFNFDTYLHKNKKTSKQILVSLGFYEEEDILKLDDSKFKKKALQYFSLIRQSYLDQTIFVNTMLRRLFLQNNDATVAFEPDENFLRLNSYKKRRPLRDQCVRRMMEFLEKEVFTNSKERTQYFDKSSLFKESQIELCVLDFYREPNYLTFEANLFFDPNTPPDSIMSSTKKKQRVSGESITPTRTDDDKSIATIQNELLGLISMAISLQIFILLFCVLLYYLLFREKNSAANNGDETVNILVVLLVISSLLCVMNTIIKNQIDIKYALLSQLKSFD